MRITKADLIIIAESNGHELGRWSKLKTSSGPSKTLDVTYGSHTYCVHCQGSLNYYQDGDHNGSVLSSLCQSNRRFVLGPLDPEHFLPSLRKRLFQGQQILYVPGHAANLDDPACAPGFVTSWSDDYVFCRFWELRSGNPILMLRNSSCSEAVGWADLYIKWSVPREWVSGMITTYCTKE